MNSPLLNEEEPRDLSLCWWVLAALESWPICTLDTFLGTVLILVMFSCGNYEPVPLLSTRCVCHLSLFLSNRG